MQWPAALENPVTNDHLDRANRVMAEAESLVEAARVAAELALEKFRTAVFELQRASQEAKENGERHNHTV